MIKFDGYVAGLTKAPDFLHLAAGKTAAKLNAPANLCYQRLAPRHSSAKALQIHGSGINLSLLISKKGAGILGVGQKIAAENAGWTFGANVPDTFVDHIKLSVPLYEMGHDLICQVSDFFIKNDSVVTRSAPRPAS